MSEPDFASRINICTELHQAHVGYACLQSQKRTLQWLERQWHTAFTIVTDTLAFPSRVWMIMVTFAWVTQAGPTEC